MPKIVMQAYYFVYLKTFLKNLKANTMMDTMTLEGLNLDLTEEHLAVQQAARDFAQTELLPGVIERDDKEYFPEELIRKMGDLGFMGMMVSPEYGGGGMDTVSYVLAMEELSKVDASASVIVSVNNSLVCYGLEHYGSEEQKIGRAHV